MLFRSQRHRRAGIEVAIASFGERIPVLPGTPEVLHGLANVLQNAIQFARSRVDVRIAALPDALEMTIVDDGPGFPSTILDHLGEPYVSTRAKDGSHMGLGVFIAITLLERSGAGLDFDNRADGGARVRIRWVMAPRPPGESSELHSIACMVGRLGFEPRTKGL